MLGFQRLDAYRCAVHFLGLAARLGDRAPFGYASLGEQLTRAALSVPLHIAEGSAKQDHDALRSFGLARQAALECAAILDAFGALGLVDDGELAEPAEHLERVVTMLAAVSPA